MRRIPSETKIERPIHTVEDLLIALKEYPKSTGVELQVPDSHLPISALVEYRYSDEDSQPTTIILYGD